MSEEPAAAGEPVTIELDADAAAALYAVGAMLHADAVDPASPFDLAAAFAPLGAPLELRAAPGARGRGLFATRAVAAGELLFREEAAAFFLARAPGADGVFVMSDGATGAPLATLPPWAVLRTLRDTLTLHPVFAFDAEAAYARLASLTALGGAPPHAAWASLPRVAPGVAPSAEGAADGGEADAVPPRAQLLAAVAQSNAFSAALPDADSDWKRALLWPLLGRLRVAADRERLFDDDAPFAAVNAFFVCGAAFNHACAAPAAAADVRWEEGAPAPAARFVAARDIAAGEEVTISYADADLPAAERRRKLLLTYRFACACAACVAEDPRAGTPADELAGAFPDGAGAAAQASFFARGGAYPQ